MIALAPMVDDPSMLPALVREFISAIPEHEQEQAQAELLQSMAEIFTRCGVAMPEWLLAARGQTDREERADPEYLRFVYAVMLCEAGSRMWRARRGSPPQRYGASLGARSDRPTRGQSWRSTRSRATKAHPRTG
jgi:hypothetical protein